MRLTLPGGMLVKIDRASMAASLEVRPLFLHRAVMELAARLPGSALVNRRAAKLALKDAVRPWLPDALLDRRKQGFAMPLPEWLGGESSVARMIRCEERSARLSDLLDLNAIKALGESHARGSGNFTQVLHSTFVLDRWISRWLPT
jgi:asparagine synthase (glutamine-hydrolysing)